MITEIPEQLAAEAMGFLEPRDLGAACYALGGSQALAETACWCALRRPWDDIELYAAEETWRSLYVAHSAIASMALEAFESRKGKRVDRSFSLTNLARSVLTGLKPREIFNTEVIRLAERALVEISPVVSRQRLVAAARRLGRDGRWEVAAELLRAALADNDDAAAAAEDSAMDEDESTADDAAASSDRGGLLRRVVDWLRTRRNPSPTPPPREAARVRRDALAPRWAAQLRLEASTFLVDRLYASTYVYASDGDGECVARALREGRAAVRALVAFDGAEDDAPAPSDTRWAEATLPPLPYQLAEAQLAHGRAAALCAQHVALGASHSSEDWRDIFQEGSDAFETVRADGGDAEQRARAAAGLAELWYCLASAKSLRLHDHESVEEVRRLARKSIAKTHEVLARAQVKSRTRRQLLIVLPAGTRGDPRVRLGRDAPRRHDAQGPGQGARFPRKHLRRGRRGDEPRILGRGATNPAASRPSRRMRDGKYPTTHARPAEQRLRDSRGDPHLGRGSDRRRPPRRRAAAPT